MMDLESASALVRTLFTVPLLVVTVVVVGAVLVRRRPARRRHTPPTSPARSASADRAPWAGHQPPPPVDPAPPGPPGFRAGSADPPGEATACAEHGHDLVVDHDSRTGLPSRIRCVARSCGASWDAVPDGPDDQQLAAGNRRPAPPGGPVRPGADRSRPTARAPDRSWRAQPGTNASNW